MVGPPIFGVSLLTVCCAVLSYYARYKYLYTTTVCMCTCGWIVEKLVGVLAPLLSMQQQQQQQFVSCVWRFAVSAARGGLVIRGRPGLCDALSVSSHRVLFVESFEAPPNIASVVYRKTEQVVRLTQQCIVSKLFDVYGSYHRLSRFLHLVIERFGVSSSQSRRSRHTNKQMSRHTRNQTTNLFGFFSQPVR